MPRKVTTMSATTKLDLDAAISRDEYTNSVSNMIEFMEGQLADRHDWCTERWRYFSSIFPEFIEDTFASKAALQFDTVKHDETQNDQYAARLKAARARLLWYVKNGTISLDEANEILEHGGLPMHTDDKSGVRLHVDLPTMVLNVGGDDPVEWVRGNMVRLITNALEGKPVDDDSRYVPGSVKFDSETAYYVTRTANDKPITDDMVMRPGTGVGFTN